MNDRLKTRIQDFWQGKLSDTHRRELLSELNSGEQQLRDSMESEFGETPDDEQLHRTEDYRVYLQAIHGKCGIDLLKKPRRLWYRWAAAASVLLVGATLYWLGGINRNEVRTHKVESGFASMLDTVVIHNTTEVSKMYRLADGSRVTLNAGSKVRYLVDYGTEARYLTLTGRAKFDVVSDTARPFVVLANGYSTTALGTSFVVDTRPNNGLEVRLLSGQVVVKSSRESPFEIKDHYLVPGEELMIDVNRSAVRKLSFGNRAKPNPEPVIEAARAQAQLPVNRFHFEEIPLSEVLDEISAANGVDLDLSAVHVDELYFTGTFSEKDDLEQMLKIICAMNGLVYEKTEADTIIVRAKP